MIVFSVLQFQAGSSRARPTVGVAHVRRLKQTRRTSRSCGNTPHPLPATSGHPRPLPATWRRDVKKNSLHLDMTNDHAPTDTGDHEVYV